MNLDLRKQSSYPPNFNFLYDFVLEVNRFLKWLDKLQTLCIVLAPSLSGFENLLQCPIEYICLKLGLFH